MNDDFPTPPSTHVHNRASRYDVHQHFHRHQHFPGSTYSHRPVVSFVSSSHRRRLVASSHVSHDQKTISTTQHYLHEYDAITSSMNKGRFRVKVLILAQ
jgi:hypothetical protein